LSTALLKVIVMVWVVTGCVVKSRSAAPGTEVNGAAAKGSFQKFVVAVVPATAALNAVVEATVTAIPLDVFEL
jgi:hypothetical protein